MSDVYVRPKTAKEKAQIMLDSEKPGAMVWSKLMLSDSWFRDLNPAWDWYQYDYKIVFPMPAPRKIYLRQDRNGDLIPHCFTKASLADSIYAGDKTIEFIEVVNQESPNNTAYGKVTEEPKSTVVVNNYVDVIKSFYVIKIKKIFDGTKLFQDLHFEDDKKILSNGSMSHCIVFTKHIEKAFKFADKQKCSSECVRLKELVNDFKLSLSSYIILVPVKVECVNDAWREVNE